MTMINDNVVNKAIEYYNQGNSITQTTKLINEEFGISTNRETIRRKLSNLGITREPSKSIILNHRKRAPVKAITKLYVDELWPIRKLSREFKIGRGTINKILKEQNIKQRGPDVDTRLYNLKYEKKKVNLNPTEKAYMFGLVSGDLTPVKRSKFTIRLITHSTHSTFVKLIEEVFGKYGRFKATITKNKTSMRIVADLDLSTFDFLLTSKEDKIPKWINEDNFLHYLSGLIDADGSLILRKSGKYFQYIIRLCGEEAFLMKSIKEKLEGMKIHVSLYKNFDKGTERLWNNKIMRYNKDYYCLDIYRKEESIDLIQSLHIKHPEKLIKKDLMLGIYGKDYNLWKDIGNEVKRVRLKIKEEAKTMPKTS